MMMTFNELRVLTIESLGLTIDQAKKVKAKVTPLTAWNNYGRLIIAGLEFGGDGDFKFGAQPNHLGGVQYYHGRGAQEVRDFVLQASQ